MTPTIAAASGSVIQEFTQVVRAPPPNPVIDGTNVVAEPGTPATRTPATSRSWCRPPRRFGGQAGAKMRRDHRACSAYAQRQRHQQRDGEHAGHDHRGAA